MLGGTAWRTNPRSPDFAHFRRLTLQRCICLPEASLAAWDVPSTWLSTAKQNSIGGNLWVSWFANTRASRHVNICLVSLRFFHFSQAATWMPPWQHQNVLLLKWPVNPCSHWNKPSFFQTIKKETWKPPTKQQNKTKPNQKTFMKQSSQSTLVSMVGEPPVLFRINVRPAGVCPSVHEHVTWRQPLPREPEWKRSCSYTHMGWLRLSHHKYIPTLNKSYLGMWIRSIPPTPNASLLNHHTSQHILGLTKRMWWVTIWTLHCKPKS